MSMTLNEFKPGDTYITLQKKLYRLLPFDLYAEVWAIEKYGSIAKMLKALNSPTKKHPLAVIEVMHFLLADKSVFKSYTDIITLTEKISKTAFINVVREGHKGIKKVINDSSPLIKNPQRVRDLNKIAEHNGTMEKVCYASYYDKLAARYSYTIDEFYKLTMRQLHSLFKAMRHNQYKELEIQAAMAGRELKPQMEMIDDITPEQEKKLDAATDDAYERLMAEYKKGQAKNGG